MKPTLQQALEKEEFLQALDDYKIGSCFSEVTLIDRSILLKELLACGKDAVDAVMNWFESNLYLKCLPSDIEPTSFSHTVSVKQPKLITTIHKLLSIIYLNVVGDGYLGKYEFTLVDCSNTPMEYMDVVELNIDIDGYSSSDAIGEGVIRILIEDDLTGGTLEFSNDVVYTNMLDLSTGVVKTQTFIDIGSVILTDFVNRLYQVAKKKLENFIVE